MRLLLNVGVSLALSSVWMTATIADDEYFRIKSKTASGNGCPDEHWVTAVANTGSGDNANVTRLELGYPDFTPSVTPQEPVRFSSSSCRVTLKIDKIRPGYQFAVIGIVNSVSGFFEYWEQWRQRFQTDVSYPEGGPLISLDAVEALGAGSNKLDFNADATLATINLTNLTWSQCFQGNEDTELVIYDRVTLGWNGGGRNNDVTVTGRGRYGFLGRYQLGGNSIPKRTKIGLRWRPCE